jgi:hypothetical protein
LARASERFCTPADIFARSSLYGFAMFGQRVPPLPELVGVFDIPGHEQL